MLTSEQLEKARQARNQYARDWRAKNRDKVKANNERYWERQAKKLSEETEGKNGFTDEDD